MIVLATVFALILAAVQLGLRDRIAQNKQAQTLSQIPLLLPGADLKKTVTLKAALEQKTIAIYQAFDANDRLLGYVVPAQGAGFNDQIELLIAYDPSLQRLRGISVISQKETPGLGDNMTKPAFTKSFAGKKPGQIHAVQPGFAASETEIDALSGATVSSQSVCNIVNRVTQGLRLQGGQP